MAEVAAAALVFVVPEGLRPIEVAYLGSPGSGERSVSLPASGLDRACDVDLLSRGRFDMDLLLDVFVQHQSLEYSPGDLSPILMHAGTNPAAAGATLMSRSRKPSIALATLEGHELSVWYTAFQEGAGI